VLTYGFALRDWLAVDDTLQSVTFTAPAGLTVGTQTINGAPMTIDGATHAAGTVALAELSGGFLGVVYPVLLHFVTTAGDEDEITLHVNMVKR
jgi:hypothetical protein